MKALLIKLHYKLLDWVESFNTKLAQKRVPGPNLLEAVYEMPVRRDKLCLDYTLTLIHKYGNIVKVPSLDNHFLIVEPALFEHILKTNASSFPKKNVTFERMRELFGQGSLVTDGPKWLTHRRAINGAFHRKHFEDYAQIIVASTEQWLKTQTLGKKFDCAYAMIELALDIVFKLFIGDNAANEATTQLQEDITLCNAAIGLPLFFGKKRRFQHAISRIDAYMHKIVEKKPSDTPFMRNLLAHEALSAQDKVDELKTIVLAGHDTVAAALAWAWYLLAQNSHYYDWLREELEEVIGDRAPNYSDYEKLIRTKAVFQETIRLYPPVWALTRQSADEAHWGSYRFPKGSLMILSLYALQRNPAFWSEPDKFFPERFLDGAESNPAYCAFNMGPHSCVAQHLAMMEGVLILATIARAHSFVLSKKNFVPKIDVWVTLRLQTLPTALAAL